MPGEGGLLVFVDRSGRVYALVAVEEAAVGELRRALRWVKHFKRLGGRRRRPYLKAFPRRFRRVARHLSYARVFMRVEDLERFLRSVSGRVERVYCDDHLYPRLGASLSSLSISPESRTPAELRPLALLADSLANYYRLMLERGRAERARELEK